MKWNHNLSQPDGGEHDWLGHVMGDQLLQAVANRLQSAIPTTDTVCRQGGDEFFLMLPEIGDPLDAGHVAKGLLAAFAKPYIINGHELHLTEKSRYTVLCERILEGFVGNCVASKA
ncbi:MAG: GGDEF domain-containing protein [Candidatus Thiodiazotropha sp.]